MTNTNETSKKLLDLHPSLHFSLLRLQLIELIRSSPTSPGPAIEFAQTYLAPRAPTHPSFLRDLEMTMALLIYPPENLTKELSALLEPNLRESVAANVNEAILAGHGHRSSTRLRSLVKLRAWAEDQARSDENVRAGLPERMSIWGVDGGDTVMGGGDTEGTGS